MSEELLKRVETACEHTELSQAEMLRLALKIGLSDLEAIHYDIDGELAKAAQRHKRGETSDFAQDRPNLMGSHLNEGPVTYPSARRKAK